MELEVIRFCMLHAIWIFFSFLLNGAVAKQAIPYVDLLTQVFHAWPDPFEM